MKSRQKYFIISKIHHRSVETKTLFEGAQITFVTKALKSHNELFKSSMNHTLSNSKKDSRFKTQETQARNFALSDLRDANPQGKQTQSQAQSCHSTCLHIIM